MRSQQHSLKRYKYSKQTPCRNGFLAKLEEPVLFMVGRMSLNNAVPREKIVLRR
jgi:hypothetical protein